MKNHAFFPVFTLAALALLGAFFVRPMLHTLPDQPAYDHQITFKVANVKVATDTLWAKPYFDVLQRTFVDQVLEEIRYDENRKAPKREILGYSRHQNPLVEVTDNGFFEAVHRAYGSHRPLVLSPDMIWLVIAQGAALHIKLNAEELRHHFVSHEGKKVLYADLTGQLSLNASVDSDWTWIFNTYGDQIAQNTNAEIAELFAARFSGTHTHAAIAFDLTLMDAMSSYFEYWGGIVCGIPTVTLEGTPEDWQQLEARAARLCSYGLDWWWKDLQPILAKFTQTAQGNPDRQFWEGIVRSIYEPVCGGDEYVNGWVAKLYPYVKDGRNGYKRNPLLGLNPASLYTFNNDPLEYYVDGISTRTNLPAPAPDTSFIHLYYCEAKRSQPIKYTGPQVETTDIPSGITSTILNVDDNGVLHKLELKAGFFGIEQNNTTKSLRPHIGWAVIKTGEKPDAEAIQGYEDWKARRN